MILAILAQGLQGVWRWETARSPPICVALYAGVAFVCFCLSSQFQPFLVAPKPITSRNKMQSWKRIVALAMENSGIRTRLIVRPSTQGSRTWIVHVPRTTLVLGLTMGCATKRVVFVQRERIARIAVRAIGTGAYQKHKYPNQRPWTSARIGRRSNYQRRLQRRANV